MLLYRPTNWPPYYFLGIPQSVWPSKTSLELFGFLLCSMIAGDFLGTLGGTLWGESKYDGASLAFCAEECGPMHRAYSGELSGTLDGLRDSLDF